MTRELLATRLESLLTELHDQYTAMALQVGLHRSALSCADGRGAEACALAEAQTLAAIAELEQRRRELVAASCTRFPSLGNKMAQTITLSDLAGAVDESQRPRLLSRAKEVRALIGAVLEQLRMMKGATRSLLAHMDGLMRQVGKQLSHACLLYTSPSPRD